MRITKIVLFLGILGACPYLLADEAPSVPEVCVKLLASLEACDRGPKGLFGSVRKVCKDTANSEYKCPLPVADIRKLLKK
jgi:hypothetical protein